MSEIQRLLDRQASWQKTRREFSWPEKIRMAEAIRGSVRQFRQPCQDSPKLPKASGTRPPFAAG